MKTRKIELKGLWLAWLILTANVWAQTTAFNYQGRLTEGGNPANSAYQMQFKLFDSLAGGTQLGATLSDLPVTVTNGVFATKLDFGANALSGANRWLEIAVRRNAGESYTTLMPREQIASSPYAVRTLSASIADNALQLGGIAASEYVTTTNGGNSFIRNGTTLQTADFNISGGGQFGGNVSIGASPLASYKLFVESTGNAIWGHSTNGWGIYGSSSGGGSGSYAGVFDGRMYVRDSVGIGVGQPLRLLHVNGRARIGSIPLEASAAQVCFNASGDLLQCGASSLKWKTDIRPFNLGLGTILRLRPINFKWKESGLFDFGLGAEDVANIAPELTITDENGEVKGVKYDRLNVVFINAFKEQQNLIETQRREIDALKKLVCQSNRQAEICKEKR